MGPFAPQPGYPGAAGIGGGTPTENPRAGLPPGEATLPGRLHSQGQPAAGLRPASRRQPSFQACDEGSLGGPLCEGASLRPPLRVDGGHTSGRHPFLLTDLHVPQVDEDSRLMELTPEFLKQVHRHLAPFASALTRGDHRTRSCSTSRTTHLRHRML